MTCDVLVIGAGVMGLSAAAEIVRRGHSVIVLDRNEFNHTLGSSHGDTRVIRTAYFEHPNYVPLAQRAWTSYQQLEDRHNTRLLEPTGGIYGGPPSSPLITGSIQAAQLHGLDHLVGLEARQKLRGGKIAIPEGYEVFWEAQCGVLYAARVLAELRRTIDATRASMRFGASVSSWEAGEWGVQVTSSQGVFEAGALVLCPGPWAPELLPWIGSQLNVTRQVVGYRNLRSRDSFRAPEFPVLCVATAEGEFFYFVPGVPSGGSHQGQLKVGSHLLGAVTTPSEVDRMPSVDDAQILVSGLSRFLPGAAGPLDALEVCLYTNTPDGHFIVDSHPEHGNVVFAAAGNGHAFKFGPVLGEALADLALNQKTNLPIDFLRASRFSATSAEAV